MNALLLAVFQTFNYALASINIRACSHAKYGATIITDGLIAALQFVVIQHVANAATTLDQVGYIIGGMVGGALGIWLSDHWKHESSNLEHK